ncbi:hypothetical protein [Chitinophaga sp.]|uniref:hypothetical protein n=1 Tax=Chitinophaga sp. TaxID=1869181 RepID=UPI002F95BB39
MFAYSIINFHELPLGSLCDVIANKFHLPIQQTAVLQKLRQISANYQLQEHWSTTYKLCVSDIFITEQLLHQWIYVAQNILYPAAIPGHTVVITQHDINNAIID